MRLELNENEANALLQLIDLAVKSGGMQVAKAGVVLSEKIHAASQEVVVGEGTNKDKGE